MTGLISRRTFLCTGALALATPARMGRATNAAPVTPQRTPLGTGTGLERLLGQRRMVRRFKSDPVRNELVERLITMARRAPSAGHTQPWAFVVVRDAERRTLLGRAALGQMFVAQAPVVIVACADTSRSKARYGSRGERYALIDTAFASLCLLLAAAEEGLGACFVGAFHDADVVQLLRLPEYVQPLALIPVGYPAEAPRPQKLRSQRDVVHDERW